MRPKSVCASGECVRPQYCDHIKRGRLTFGFLANARTHARVGVRRCGCVCVEVWVRVRLRANCKRESRPKSRTPSESECERVEVVVRGHTACADNLIAV